MKSEGGGPGSTGVPPAQREELGVGESVSSQAVPKFRDGLGREQTNSRQPDTGVAPAIPAAGLSVPQSASRHSSSFRVCTSPSKPRLAASVSLRASYVGNLSAPPPAPAQLGTPPASSGMLDSAKPPADLGTVACNPGVTDDTGPGSRSDSAAGESPSPRPESAAGRWRTAPATWLSRLALTEFRPAPRIVFAVPTGAPVAQLDRASGYEPEGRGFESLRARHLFSCTSYS